MTDNEMMKFLDNSNNIEFNYNPQNCNYSGLGELESATTVHGYDKNGEPTFFAVFDEDNNYRLDLYKDSIKYQFYSHQLEDLALTPQQLKNLNAASTFINKLKTLNKSKNITPSKSPSLDDELKNGLKLKLSEKSRLSFAPNIEELIIKKDKNGVLTMKGLSKDNNQSIDFTFNSGQIEMSIDDGNIARKYNNKIGGKFTYRDLKSPNNTYYIGDEGEKYAKEMASIMNKLKAQYQQRNQQNSQTTTYNQSVKNR